MKIFSIQFRYIDEHALDNVSEYYIKGNTTPEKFEEDFKIAKDKMLEDFDFYGEDTYLLGILVKNYMIQHLGYQNLISESQVYLDWSKEFDKKLSS